MSEKKDVIKELKMAAEQKKELRDKQSKEDSTDTKREERAEAKKKSKKDKKEEEKPKVELERIYIIPLRNANRTARTKRAPLAMTLIRRFLTRHMKCETVKIGKELNEAVWSRSIQKPPAYVRVKASKYGTTVEAELAK
ncbi:MAG: 50S ribosomal protein L31e [archaeon]